MKQLVIKGNRVLAHGEDCFLSMGGTVICTETGRAFDNATVTNITGAIPADIDSVGYEYHAGEFVPCAPFGKGSGNIAVVCNDDCKTIKDSGYLIPNYSNWKFTGSSTPFILLIGNMENTNVETFPSEQPFTGSGFAKSGFRARINGTVNLRIRYRTGSSHFVLYMQVDDEEPEVLDDNIFHNNTTLDTNSYSISVKAGARYTFYFSYREGTNTGNLRIAEITIRANAPDISTISDVWSDVPDDVAIFDPIAQLRADVDYIAAQMDITL